MPGVPERHDGQCDVGMDTACPFAGTPTQADGHALMVEPDHQHLKRLEAAGAERTPKSARVRPPGASLDTRMVYRALCQGVLLYFPRSGGLIRAAKGDTLGSTSQNRAGGRKFRLNVEVGSVLWGCTPAGVRWRR